MHLNNPQLVGFGISNRATREAADAHTAGVIVGSKFVTLLAENITHKRRLRLSSRRWSNNGYVTYFHAIIL